MDRNVEQILSGIPNAAEASAIIVQLAAGIPLEVDRLSLDALPAVILLSYVAYLNDQCITDNYSHLFIRLRTEFLYNRDFKDRYPWVPRMHLVSVIEQQVDANGNNARDDILETAIDPVQFIFNAYKVLIDANLETIMPELNGHKEDK